MMPRVRARFHLYLVSLSCIFASTLCLLYELMNRIRAIQTKVFQRKRLDWFCFCALFLALSLSLSLSLRCCPRWSHSRFYSYSHSLSLISLIASLDLWSAARSFFLSLSLSRVVCAQCQSGRLSVRINYCIRPTLWSAAFLSATSALPYPSPLTPFPFSWLSVWRTSPHTHGETGGVFFCRQSPCTFFLSLAFHQLY